jgi:toxin-antitoxin system PIN domain toxin
MIAVDTNLLVYAHRRDSSWHNGAKALVAELAEGRAPWAIPWPCVHDFLAIVMHPRIHSPPTPVTAGIAQMDAWLASPSVALLAEADGYWQELAPMLRDGRIAGPRVHDARVAALCRLHGVRELWTADRDS